VALESCLTLNCHAVKQHITWIARNCFYHLRQIRRVVGEDVTSQLISVFVLSRLDYCNSLLAGLPRTSVEPLQRVQNAAARLVLNLGLRDHVTPALKQLHWLPVEHRIKQKSCTLMHQIHTGRAPRWLAHSVQSIAESSRRPGLWSANTANYIKRRTRTKFGQRCLSHTGSAAWNPYLTALRCLSHTGSAAWNPYLTVTLVQLPGIPT